MIRLADTRDLTTEQADHCMSEIRRLTCDREKVLARYEARIARLTAEAQDMTADYDRELERLTSQLAQYIMAHSERFEKPRKRKTPDGTYGLHTSTRLCVDNEDLLIEALCDRGYTECIKRVKHKLVKPAIVRLLTAGETLPGATLEVGEIAHCKVHKALIDEARNAAIN